MALFVCHLHGWFLAGDSLYRGDRLVILACAGLPDSFSYKSKYGGLGGRVYSECNLPWALCSDLYIVFALCLYLRVAGCNQVSLC